MTFPKLSNVRYLFIYRTFRSAECLEYVPQIYIAWAHF